MKKARVYKGDKKREDRVRVRIDREIYGNMKWIRIGKSKHIKMTFLEYITGLSTILSVMEF